MIQIIGNSWVLRGDLEGGEGVPCSPAGRRNRSSSVATRPPFCSPCCVLRPFLFRFFNCAPIGGNYLQNRGVFCFGIATCGGCNNCETVPAEQTKRKLGVSNAIPENPQHVEPEILGPVYGQFLQAAAVPGVEGARVLFVIGKVAGDGAHEAASRFKCTSHAGAALVVLASGLVHESAQRRRGAVGLLFEPLPVTGEQGDLAADHAQFRASWTNARWRRQSTRHYVLQGTPQVEVHLPAGLVFKYKNRSTFVLVEARFKLAEHLREGAGGEHRVAGEGRVGLI